MLTQWKVHLLLKMCIHLIVWVCGLIHCSCYFDRAEDWFKYLRLRIDWRKVEFALGHCGTSIHRIPAQTSPSNADYRQSFLWCGKMFLLSCWAMIKIYCVCRSKLYLKWSFTKGPFPWTIQPPCSTKFSAKINFHILPQFNSLCTLLPIF